MERNTQKKGKTLEIKVIRKRKGKVIFWGQQSTSYQRETLCVAPGQTSYRRYWYQIKGNQTNIRINVRERGKRKQQEEQG